MIYCQGLRFYFTPSKQQMWWKMYFPPLCARAHNPPLSLSLLSSDWLTLVTWPQYWVLIGHCSEINVVSLLNLPGMFLISVNQSQLHLNISTWEYSQHNLYSLLLESSWRHKLDKMLTIQDQVCVLIDKNDKKKSTHVKSHLKPFTFLYILEYC